MNGSFNRQLTTVIIPEFLANAGKRAHELRPFELGLIDCDSGLTVDKATYATDKVYQLVFKTPSKGANNPMFPDQYGTQLPIRSLPISKINKVHLFDKANEEQKPFVAYLGYDGLNDCKCLSFPCGTELALEVTVRGESVRNTFNRNLKQLIPFSMPCCDDCASDTASEKVADAIVDAIKNSPFYAKNYFKAEKILSCCPAESPFDKKLYKTFQLTVCDSGTSRDLAKVQAQYPDFEVTCIDRTSPFSTYEVCIPCPYLAADQTAIDAAKDALVVAQEAMPLDQAAVDAAQATLDAAIVTASANAEAACMPEDFVMKNVAPLKCDLCPDCPNTFTKVEAGDKYITCFDSATNALVTTLEEFTLEYYTDQDTAQDTIDALVEAAAATIPGYVAESATVIEANCDKVTLQVCVVKDTVLTEHGVAGLTVTHIGECTGMCEGESTLPWCPKDDKYKIQRTLCITVKDDECGEDFLEEIEESLKNEKDVILSSLVISKANGCITEYKVDQCNNECLEDGCDTFGKDGAEFDFLPAFKGSIWKTCDCEGWTIDAGGCPVAPSVDLTNCCSGVKFTGAFTPREILECTYSIDDNVEREPLELEVAIVQSLNDEANWDTQCEVPNVAWTVVQWGTAAEGRGEYLMRDEVLSRGYELYKYFNPKQENGNLMAQRMGYEYLTDPSKFYNCISLYHNYDRDRYHWDTSHTRELIQVAVESTNVVLLEELKDFFNKTILCMGHVKLL